MTKTIYQRKRHIIHTPDGVQDFKTINKAKRESRRLQIATDGALGRGSLRVVRS